MTNPLLHLDVQRLRNTFHAWRTNPKEARRVLFFVLGISLFLWWNVLRHVSARKTGFIEIWPVLRYLFPVLFGSVAAGIGAYGRVSRWLSRWASGSWSVLSLDPRTISQWLLVAMLIVDAGWVLIALALSIGLTFVAGLPWWHEFPFLLFATLLLVAAGSTAKIFASLLLRLAVPRVLLWQNWILRATGAFIAALLVQPLSALWLLAEYARHEEQYALSALVLIVLAGAAAGLALLARRLVMSSWRGIAASFEVQQTTVRANESVPIAAFVARRMPTPAGKFFTLYNLRSGIELRRFGQPVMAGGRRIYMLLPLVAVALALVIGVGYGASRDHQWMLAALFGGAWGSMVATVVLPPIGPAYRLMRMLPVSFHDWLRAAIALPLFVAFVFGAICCLVLGLADPSGAFRWYGMVAGILLATVPLRVFIASALPDGGQTAEFMYMIAIALGVLAYFGLTWIGVVPVMLTVNYYFYRKAARLWRSREEGLSV